MKVAIAGFGIEGQASYRYYSKLGADITIADENEKLKNIPEGANVLLGEGIFEKLHDFDLVIQSPQINPAHIFTHGKIWSTTNEFFAKCPAPIIGVTGTKGKGTTSSLIAEVLKASGRTVHLVGNIGVSALDELEKIKAEDFVVFELSSFQLWDIEKSPETAVVLMIEGDHQDVHASMEEYVNAKANITLHQSAQDLLVHHPTNKYSIQIAEKSPAKKIAYMTNQGANVVISTEVEKSNQISRQARDDRVIVIQNQEICKVSEVGLIGEHNLENVCAAITAVWQYIQNVEAIKKAVISFKGLEHRLEFVRELGGVKYYNDSFSSAVGATIAAIKSFNQPIVLICGGHDKGNDFTELAKSANETTLKKVIVIGEAKDAIEKVFSENSNLQVEVMQSTDFQEIIHHAKDSAVIGDVVLLSPGTSSFDMFKNFYERGSEFKKIVREL